MNVIPTFAEPDESSIPWEFVPEQRVVLHNVSWDAYVAIGNALADRPNLRLTYDRGNLEIMTTSPEHERQKIVLHLLIHVMAEELNIPVGCLGSTTYQREDIDRGLEPDDCYYLENWPKVRGKKRLDLPTDPPPDLAIEVEVTRSALKRMNIYAKLGVPEVWRFDGTSLRVYLRNTQGEYEEQERSRMFPAVAPTDLVRFFGDGTLDDDTALARSFRAWLRRHLGLNG